MSRTPNLTGLHPTGPHSPGQAGPECPLRSRTWDSQTIYCQGVLKSCNFKINNCKTPLPKCHYFMLNTSVKVQWWTLGLLFEALIFVSSASTVFKKKKKKKGVFSCFGCQQILKRYLFSLVFSFWKQRGVSQPRYTHPKLRYGNMWDMSLSLRGSEPQRSKILNQMEDLSFRMSTSS